MLEDICKIKFNNCHFLVEFHINKIKQMNLDPHKILNEIENDKPRQFVILKNFYVSISHKIMNYSCSEIQSYMQDGKILLYCKVNV